MLSPLTQYRAFWDTARCHFFHRAILAGTTSVRLITEHKILRQVQALPCSFRIQTMCRNSNMPAKRSCPDSACRNMPDAFLLIAAGRGTARLKAGLGQSKDLRSHVILWQEPLASTALAAAPLVPWTLRSCPPPCAGLSICYRNPAHA